MGRHRKEKLVKLGILVGYDLFFNGPYLGGNCHKWLVVLIFIYHQLSGLALPTQVVNPLSHISTLPVLGSYLIFNHRSHGPFRTSDIIWKHININTERNHSIKTFGKLLLWKTLLTLLWGHVTSLLFCIVYFVFIQWRRNYIGT